MPLLSASAAVRAGFAALRTNPLRTFLSALGVVIGIGAMISVLALSDGVEASIRKQLAADGRLLTLRLAPQTMQFVDGLMMPRTDAPAFGMADVASLGGAIGATGTVDLAVGGPAYVTVAPGYPRRGMMLRGMRIAPAMLREHPPVAGRFFSTEEADRGERLLVLSDPLAAALATTLADSTAGALVMQLQRGPPFGAERSRATRVQPTTAACRALVGRTVGVGDQQWRIIGVMAPAEGTETECSGKVAPVRLAPGNPLTRLTAAAPASAAMSAVLPLTGARANPAALVVTANRVEELPTLRKATEAWLAARYGRPSGTGASASGGWKERVDLSSYERESESVRQGMLVFRLLMTAITGISLVVGGVGIMNVLLATVTERTREIGISKAVGARRRDVLVQYLAESVAIAATGAVLGTVLGYGVAQGVAAFMRAQATIPVHAGFSLSTLLVAVGAPLVVGVSFGMYPALRASRLSPIDAIRHE